MNVPHDAVLPVTVVVPVKNEERNLPRCLAALGGFAHVLVVDSSSTDGTVAIAKAAGAEVIDFHWTGGFPKKRNWVLQTYDFKTDWVLFLDADELVTPAFVSALADALRRPDVVGYWLNYENHFLGRTLRHGVPQRKLALFRVGAGLYERIDDRGWSSLDMEVHEHPILDGPVSALPERIIHHDYRGMDHYLGRHNAYSTWEAQRYCALVRDPVAWGALTDRQRLKYANLRRWWFAPAYFLVTYVVRAGFLDGWAGFVHAALKLAYFFEVRLKIMEAIGEAAP